MSIYPDARRPAASRHALAWAAALVSVSLATATSAEVLTLPEALSRAAAYDPTRPASAARVQAAEAGVRQAGVRPNPSVGVDLENFSGTGSQSAFDRSEATVYYQQTLERGGKREARTDVARADVLLARQRSAVRALDILAEVQTAWVGALAAEAAVAVAQERLTVAERLNREVGRRVAAARDPLFAGERSRTAVLQGQIARDQAVEIARQARATLARFWGGGETFDLDVRGLAQTSAAPVPRPVQTPDLALLTAERDAAASRIRLERSRAVQDPTWRVGVRHFGDGNEVALVVGGAIPLGRYDRNVGGVARAQAERTAAEAEIIAATAALDREIANLTARRASTLTEVRRIDAEVLPSAAKALMLVRAGFNRGGGAFTYLEVAESQRAVVETKARRVDLLKSFHLDGVRLDRLTGRHLPLISVAETR